MTKGPLLAVVLALTLFPLSALAADQGLSTSGTNLGSVTGGEIRKAHVIIDKKCTACHSVKRIEEALAAGKDMLAIQHRMEQKGVTLNSNEKSVLGIFWQRSPLKKAK